MLDIRNLEVAKMKHSKLWMRRGKVDQAIVQQRAESLKTHGQMSLITVLLNADGSMEVEDGNYRLLAAPLAGMTHLDSVVISNKSEAELLEAQFVIDAHRLDASATQRARTLAAIQERRGCTVTELARRMILSQSMATKYLAIDGASAEVKALLDEGRIDIEHAYMLSTISDPAIIAQAPSLTRDQLRAKIKSKDKPDVKTSSVRLALPGQMLITLKGPSFDMPTLLEVLQEGAKQVKKAMGAGHDVSSVQRYLATAVKAING